MANTWSCTTRLTLVGAVQFVASVTIHAVAFQILNLALDEAGKSIEHTAELSMIFGFLWNSGYSWSG